MDAGIANNKMITGLTFRNFAEADQTKHLTGRSHLKDFSLAVRSVTVLILICKTAGLPTGEPKDDVKKYFDSMVSKPTPLWFCRGWIEGIKWRIPKPIQCPLLPVDEPSTVVDITIWWQDISMQTMDGYECYAVKSVKVAMYYFFGSRTYESYTEKYPVSERDCRVMATDKKTPDGEKLEHIRDGYFATKHIPNPQESWTREVRDEVVNYFVISLKFAISNVDDTVQTTTKLSESCHYDRGFCFSELGISIWHVKDVKQCRIRKGASTSCILTGNRLSCPELTMSTNYVKNVPVCGYMMGTGDTGLLFSQDIGGTVDTSTIVTSDLEDHLHLRRKRAFNRKSSVSSPMFVSDKELNSRFQYLYDLVSGNVSYALQQFHIDICKTNKVMLDMMRSLASGGSPTTLVRALLGEPSYKARLDGDVVSIWKCAAVYDYMFISTEKCTVEYPVKYVDNHETRTGWVTPISHEIVDTPTEIPCPGTDFYFETENMIILLANKSVVSNLPILPSPQRDSDLKGYQMPDLSFVAPGAYSAEDISGQETILGVIRQLQSKLVLDNAIRSRMNGKGFDSEQLAALNTLSGIIVNPFYFIFYKLLAVLLPGLLCLAIYKYRIQIKNILLKLFTKVGIMKLNNRCSRKTTSKNNLESRLPAECNDTCVDFRVERPNYQQENGNFINSIPRNKSLQAVTPSIYPSCPKSVDFDSSDGE